jgi:hypothetical protein
MSFFKKIEKKLRNVKDKIVDDIIPNEFKSGSKMKKTIRNLIPNELSICCNDTWSTRYSCINAGTW